MTFTILVVAFYGLNVHAKKAPRHGLSPFSWTTVIAAPVAHCSGVVVELVEDCWHCLLAMMATSIRDERAQQGRGSAMAETASAETIGSSTGRRDSRHVASPSCQPLSQCRPIRCPLIT